MKTIEKKTMEYMFLLQDYINKVENGEYDIHSEEINKLNDLLEDCKRIVDKAKGLNNTSDLSCFNGKYEFTAENCEYYIKELCRMFNFECMQRGDSDWWDVTKRGKPMISCILMNDAIREDGLDVKYLLLDYGTKSYPINTFFVLYDLFAMYDLNELD